MPQDVPGRCLGDVCLDHWGVEPVEVLFHRQGRVSVPLDRRDDDVSGQLRSQVKPPGTREEGDGNPLGLCHDVSMPGRSDNPGTRAGQGRRRSLSSCC